VRIKKHQDNSKEKRILHKERGGGKTPDGGVIVRKKGGEKKKEICGGKRQREKEANDKHRTWEDRKGKQRACHNTASEYQKRAILGYDT